VHVERTKKDPAFRKEVEELVGPLDWLIKSGGIDPDSIDLDEPLQRFARVYVCVCPCTVLEMGSGVPDSRCPSFIS
jgi:hypothetical protein